MPKTLGNTIEYNTPLLPYNTFGIDVNAKQLLRINNQNQLVELATQSHSRTSLLKNGFIVLGGGSNIILTGDVQPLVLKMENRGIEVIEENDQHTIVQAAAGEVWHDFVSWTVTHGYAGLENLALIPGAVGSAPVQNIGAYGVELQDYFHSLDAIDMQTGNLLTLNAKQCCFGYRDSIFKHTPQQLNGGGLAGQTVITQVRFALPKAWKAQINYADLQSKLNEQNIQNATAQQIFDAVVAIRRKKLPDPSVIGNVGSFFKNPKLSAQQCFKILEREPKLVHYELPDGSMKLAAAWLIDACGWRGKSIENVAVYDKQALVLINRFHETGIRATGNEVITLANTIQTSVYDRFGIQLEIEPVVF